MQITETTDLKKIQEFMGKGYTLSDAREMRDVLIANGINDTETANPSTIRDCVSMAISGPGPIIGDERSYEHDPRDEPAVDFGALVASSRPQKAVPWLNNEKIRFVVINENMIGYVDPREPTSAGILSSSSIRGASFNWMNGSYPLPVDGKGVRPAAYEDFDSFRVSTLGYDNDSSYDFPHPKEVEFYMHCDGHAAVAKIPRDDYLKHFNEITNGFREKVMPNDVDLLRALTPIDSFPLKKEQSLLGVYWHKEMIEGAPHFTILPMQDSTPEQISLTEKQLRTYHGDCATSSVLQPKHWVSPQQVEQIAAAKNRQDQIKQADSALAFVVDAIGKSPATHAVSRDL